MGMVLSRNQASPDTEALPMSLRACTPGVGGGGNHSLFIFSCGFLSFLQSYQAASSVVV